MTITEQTISELSDLRREHLEADIISLLADRLHIDAQQATSLFYRSRLARQINDEKYDIQALDASYLVDDLLHYEPNLSQR